MAFHWSLVLALLLLGLIAWAYTWSKSSKNRTAGRRRALSVSGAAESACSGKIPLPQTAIAVGISEPAPLHATFTVDRI